MKPYVFTVSGGWQGGLSGRGRIESRTAVLPVAGPRELGGSGTGHDPEELVLAAASTCFLITLAAVLERLGILYTALTITSHGVVELGAQGLELKSIVHHPGVELPPAATHTDRDQVRMAIRRAETQCLIARSMKGNVAVSVVEPSERQGSQEFSIARRGQAQEPGAGELAP